MRPFAALRIFVGIIILLLSSQTVLAQGRVGRVVFSEPLGPDQKGLLKASGLVRNAPLSAAILEKAASSVENHFYENGYLYARIDSVHMQAQADAGNVDLFFYGRKGPLIKIEGLELQSVALDTMLYRQRLPQVVDKPWSATLERQLTELCLQTAAAQGYAFAEVQALPPGFMNVGGHQRSVMRIKINE